ncbi:MAG: hypothetical protein IPM29_27330 [Planctomycetes bacterium]|nr:hypothetical protein [Planctomycetota bacterium]
MRHALRRLNEAGVQDFRSWLAASRGRTATAPPSHLLDDRTRSDTVEGDILLERPGFTTKRDAAVYLRDRLRRVRSLDLHRDQGLWTWLALFYFDDVCPVTDGHRRVLDQAHYVLDHVNDRRRYRHLLATPHQILLEMPDHNRLFLDAPLSVHGDLVEQMMGRLYVIRLPGVRAALERLYFDHEGGRPKRGIMSSKKPRRGDLRNRLPARIRQLQRTYDLAAVTGEQFLQLLGPEFEPWLDGSPRLEPEVADTPAPEPSPPPDPEWVTRPLTAADLRHGQIRIPREAKAAFPPTRCELQVRVFGVQAIASYNPRMGPLVERDGILVVGNNVLAEQARPERPVALRKRADGVIEVGHPDADS